MMNESNASINLYAQLTLVVKLRTKRSRPHSVNLFLTVTYSSQCKLTLNWSRLCLTMDPDAGSELCGRDLLVRNFTTNVS